MHQTSLRAHIFRMSAGVWSVGGVPPTTCRRARALARAGGAAPPSCVRGFGTTYEGSCWQASEPWECHDQLRFPGARGDVAGRKMYLTSLIPPPGLPHLPSYRLRESAPTSASNFPHGNRPAWACLNGVGSGPCPREVRRLVGQLAPNLASRTYFPNERRGLERGWGAADKVSPGTWGRARGRRRTRKFFWWRWPQSWCASNAAAAGTPSPTTPMCAAAPHHL